MTEQFNDFRADTFRPQEDFVLHQEESFPTATFVDSGGLGDFHVNNEVQEESNGRAKLFAGIAVAVVVGIAGAYGVTQYMKDTPVVADSALPTPTAPSRTAAMTPPPAPAPAAEATTPATAPAAPDVVKPAPVTRQAAATPRMTPMSKSSSSSTASDNAVMPMPAEQTPAPVQNQAANVPEPISPAPPASSVAGNPALNQQSADQPAEQAAPADQAPAPQAASPDVTATPAPATPETAPAQ